MGSCSWPATASYCRLRRATRTGRCRPGGELDGQASRLGDQARQWHRAQGAGRGLTLTNLRGRDVIVDGNDSDWTIAVILDHDDPPAGVVPDLSEAKHPATVLLRRDWQFLFDQLKSTHAVVEYLRRVARKPVEIGTEPERYTAWPTRTTQRRLSRLTRGY